MQRCAAHCTNLDHEHIGQTFTLVSKLTFSNYVYVYNSHFIDSWFVNVIKFGGKVICHSCVCVCVKINVDSPFIFFVWLNSQPAELRALRQI